MIKKKKKENTNFRAWRIFRIILEKFEAVGMAAQPHVARPLVYLNVIAQRTDANRLVQKYYIQLV